MQAKGYENIENLDKIAASRVKYTLPGPMTILDCIKGQLISNPFCFQQQYISNQNRNYMKIRWKN